jgi:hypothetical protein
MQKIPGSDVIRFLHLLIMSAMLSSVTACQVNITNWEDAQDMFEDYTEVRNAKLVNIWTSGINWSNSLNETKEVFDPNWWRWATEDTTTLLEMPLDSKILSMGLLSIAIKDLRVHLTCVPSNCFDELDFRQQTQLVVAEILRLTDVRKKPDGDDLLCRSIYSRRSLISGNVVGVGKTCCKRKELLSRRDWDCDGKREVKEAEAFACKSAAVAVIGTLLPFMIIPGALAWWQLHPVSAGKGFAKYLMNKLTKYAHFELRGLGELDKEILIIKESDLEPYGGAVSLLELLNIDMRVSVVKIKLSFVFLLQYIPVVAWCVSYSSMAETLSKLDSTEKILLNLRNNPISWLWTDRSFCPFYIALVLVVVNFFQIVLVLVWWLMENQTVRLAFANILRNVTGRTRWRDKGEEYLYKIVQKSFTVFFINLLVCSYVSIYSLFHSILYTIGGLIVSIDIVSPWLTGGLLVAYYIQRSYSGMIDAYTEIKRLVFDVCKKNKIYKANHNDTYDITDENMETRTIQEWKQKTIHYKPVKCEGPVLFVYHLHNGGNEMAKIMITKEMLRQVCERIQPINTGIREAFVELFFTILFLFLVVFTTTVFRLHTATGEVSTLITSGATLLTALIPRLANMMGTDAESRLGDDVLKFNIEKLLNIYRPKFKVIETIKTPEYTLYGNPIQGTHTVPESPTSRQDDDFDGLQDDLPTIIHGLPINNFLEILSQFKTTPHSRRRHDSNQSTHVLPSVLESNGHDIRGHEIGANRAGYFMNGIMYHQPRTYPHDLPRDSQLDIPLNSTEMTQINANVNPQGTPEVIQVETYL